MEMDLDVAYLFRGGGARGADSDTARWHGWTSSQGPAKANDGRDQVCSKGSKQPNSTGETGIERCGSSIISPGEPYVAAYSATGKQSLRLSTASYSTTGELEMSSCGEPSTTQEKRSMMRGSSEDQPRKLNAYGVRPSEAPQSVSGPPSTTLTALVTPPSSATLTDRGQEDPLLVTQLQQKLEVSYEWAYDLERDVADLMLEVEGLRSVCTQLKQKLECKEAELAEALQINHKLNKLLASAETLLAGRLGRPGDRYSATAPPSSGGSAPPAIRGRSGYPWQMLTSASSPALQSMAMAPPRSGDLRAAAPAPCGAGAGAGAYPPLRPLRTSLSTPEMQAPAPARGVQAAAPAAPAQSPSTAAPRSGASSAGGQRLG